MPQEVVAVGDEPRDGPAVMRVLALRRSTAGSHLAVRARSRQQCCEELVPEQGIVEFEFEIAVGETVVAGVDNVMTNYRAVWQGCCRSSRRSGQCLRREESC